MGAADLTARHLPDPDWPVARPFWEATAAGELRIPRCAACGRFVWYPAATCAACGGTEHPWTHVSGRGRLFTWVRVHRAFLPGYAPRLPFTTALVELEEDARVRLATFLTDAPASGLRVGLPVEVSFERVTDRIVLPVFRCRATGPPVSEASGP
jgi:uncharacterized protein